MSWWYDHMALSFSFTPRKDMVKKQQRAADHKQPLSVDSFIMESIILRHPFHLQLADFRKLSLFFKYHIAIPEYGFILPFSSRLS